MTPPEHPKSSSAVQRENAPAVSVCVPSSNSLEVLRQRRDFVSASRARRQGTKGMMVQARERRDGTDGIRVGYTCSKKVGNAVARNRAKRRLREVARLILPQLGKPGWDYVLIGRAGETGTREFCALQQDLRHALKKLHAPSSERG